MSNVTARIVSVPPAELTVVELDMLAGGVAKRTDAASPSLFLKCCTGTHIPTATL